MGGQAPVKDTPEWGRLTAQAKLLEKHLIGLQKLSARLADRKGSLSTMDLTRQREILAQMRDKQSELVAIREALSKW
jgi:hypothetical protein